MYTMSSLDLVAVMLCKLSSDLNGVSVPIDICVILLVNKFIIRFKVVSAQNKFCCYTCIPKLCQCAERAELKTSVA